MDIINGKIGSFNGINYSWTVKDKIATITFPYKNVTLSRSMKNLSGPNIKAEHLSIASELAISLAIEDYETEEKAAAVCMRYQQNG